MANSTDGDVAAAFRDMLEQWLSLSNEMSAQAMRSTGLAAAAGDAGNVSAAARQTFAETIGRVLTGMNLPNRAEILEIGTQVAALDTRLARIEAMLAALVPAPAPAPRPPRTKRP